MEVREVERQSHSRGRRHFAACFEIICLVGQGAAGIWLEGRIVIGASRSDSNTRSVVSEEPEGLLCFLQLVRHFRMIPGRMSLKSQRACYVFFAVCTTFQSDTRANVSE